MGKDKSETKPKYTREFHSGERNGNIGIDSIIKTK